MARGQYEIEQKYRIKHPARIRSLLKTLKAKKKFSKIEYNEIYDLDGRLFNQGSVLRLRHYGGAQGLLTFKGPVLPSVYKKRIELETTVDWRKVKLIFAALGFSKRAEYTKRREEYELKGAWVTLDYLHPWGWFVEIEGMPQQIKKLSQKLGLKSQDQEGRSYLQLSLLGKKKKS